ncbi:hypothetical protein ACFW6Q_30405 [Streptomyces sp. NPDC058737]|uniref:hypothetical protein n=1 Tax=Streptomyces sp. NPDC058737 TaxID=3346617 RepID=UPI0036C81A88
METSTASPLRLRTVDDIRAALLAGHGFPGDKEALEDDLQRALEDPPEGDLPGVDSVIVDYRGRIRLHEDSTFDTAVEEGIDLAMRVKREAQPIDRFRYWSGAPS